MTSEIISHQKSASPSKKAKYIRVIDLDKCVGCQICMFACSRRFGDAGMSHTAILVHSSGDFERGFVISVCQSCDDPPCMHVCPTEALTPREGGGIHFDEKKCIGCQNCVRACIIEAIFWDPSRNKPIPCVYCGLCAKACPHDVLKLMEKEV
jgi:Fe-S-cluster-containing dehydrogenase component